VNAAGEELYEALLAATAALAGATSAYQQHASRHRSVGRSKADPFFTTRLGDFERATEADRTALLKFAERAPPKKPRQIIGDPCPVIYPDTGE
jgi:hypothetical protein